MNLIYQLMTLEYGQYFENYIRLGSTDSGRHDASQHSGGAGRSKVEVTWYLATHDRMICEQSDGGGPFPALRYDLSGNTGKPTTTLHSSSLWLLHASNCPGYNDILDREREPKTSIGKERVSGIGDARAGVYDVV